MDYRLTPNLYHHSSSRSTSLLVLIFGIYGCSLSQNSDRCGARSVPSRRSVGSMIGRHSINERIATAVMPGLRRSMRSISNLWNLRNLWMPLCWWGGRLRKKFMRNVGSCNQQHDNAARISRWVLQESCGRSCARRFRNHMLLE